MKGQTMTDTINTASKKNAARQAEFKRRQLEAGRRRIALWVTAEQEDAIKRILDGESGMDKTMADYIVDLERQVTKH